MFNFARNRYKKKTHFYILLNFYGAVLGKVRLNEVISYCLRKLKITERNAQELDAKRDIFSRGGMHF